MEMIREQLGALGDSQDFLLTQGGGQLTETKGKKFPSDTLNPTNQKKQGEKEREASFPSFVSLLGVSWLEEKYKKKYQGGEKEEQEEEGMRKEGEVREREREGEEWGKLET